MILKNLFCLPILYFIEKGEFEIGEFCLFFSLLTSTQICHESWWVVKSKGLGGGWLQDASQTSWASISRGRDPVPTHACPLLPGNMARPHFSGFFVLLGQIYSRLTMIRSASTSFVIPFIWKIELVHAQSSMLSTPHGPLHVHELGGWMNLKWVEPQNWGPWSLSHYLEGNHCKLGSPIPPWSLRNKHIITLEPLSVFVKTLLNSSQHSLAAAFCFQSTVWITFAAFRSDSKPISQVTSKAICVADAVKDVPPVRG